MTDPPNWTPLAAYGRSKLCNILFTRALAQRGSRAAGWSRRRACTPASSRPQIGDRAGGFASLGWRIAKPFLKSAKQGAATSLFLATVPDPGPFAGAYVVGAKIAGTDPAARDADRLGEQL